MTLLLPSTQVRHGNVPVTAMHRAAVDWPPEPSEPGGFVPDDLSGLAIWLDAADYSSGSWPNQVAGGAAPTFVGSPHPVVSETTLNGMPVVRFNVNQGRVRIYSGTGVTTEWTLVYVGRMVGPNYGRVVNGVYTPANILVGFWNGYEDVCYDNGFMVPNTQTTWTNHWKTYSADGTQTPILTRFFGEGTLLGTHTSGAGWGNTFAISGYNPSDTAETCDCEIAEVVLYNRKLTDEERQQVEAYLHDKWFVEHTPPPFAPNQISGLGLWLDAQEIVGLANGDPVTTWYDASSMHRDAVVIDTPPVYRATALNGHPAVEFTGTAGSSQRFLVPGWGTALTGLTDYTLFTLLYERTFPYTVMTTAPSNNLWQWLTEFDGSGGVYWGHGNGRFREINSGIAASTAHLMTFRATAADPQFYVDGVLKTSILALGGGGDMAPVVPNVGTDVILGGYYEHSYGVDGYLGAVLWYDRALTDVERVQVETYLKEKWSIT